ncbi:hypothetical protein HN935_03880 [archaeon]|nr:hypothetical protein [archaeon]
MTHHGKPEKVSVAFVYEDGVGEAVTVIDIPSGSSGGGGGGGGGNTVVVTPVVDDCTESWSCGSWSNCIASSRTRTCTDANDCDTVVDRPNLSEACICGDGLVWMGEECDDGNLTNGDGCSSSCAVESGYYCVDEPSVCSVITGNEIYVDKDSILGNGCNNNWNGSINFPKCTVHSHNWIRNDLEPGDIVYLAGNESTDYSYMYIYENSTGTEANPIIIKPYGDYEMKFDEGHGIRIYGDASHIKIYGPLHIRGGEFGYFVPDETVTNYGLELHDCVINFSANSGVRVEGVEDFVLSDCIIHGRGYSQRSENVGVNIRNGNSTNVLIQNVEVYGMDDAGSPGSSDADGFYAAYGTHTNLTFINCSAHHNGEDGFDLQADATLINCKSYNNMAGGVKVWRRVNDNYAPHTVKIVNSLIYNNGYYAPNPNDGNPGIKSSEGAGLIIENSVIFNNYDQGINAHYVEGALPIVIRNSIIANTVAGEGIRVNSSVLTEENNLFYNNQGNNIEDMDGSVIIPDATSVVGDDPLFVFPVSYNIPPVAGDYYSSLGLYGYGAEVVDFTLLLGSPAIDNGTVASYAFDFYNVSRPQGLGWDIGAYEYS